MLVAGGFAKLQHFLVSNMDHREYYCLKCNWRYFGNGPWRMDCGNDPRHPTGVVSGGFKCSSCNSYNTMHEPGLCPRCARNRVNLIKKTK